MRTLPFKFRSIHPVLDCGLRIEECGLEEKSKCPRSKIQDDIPGAVAERRMHFIVDEDDDGSSPFDPAIQILNSMPA